MTVAELIAELQRHPPGRDVRIVVDVIVSAADETGLLQVTSDIWCVRNQGDHVAIEAAAEAFLSEVEAMWERLTTAGAA